MRTRTSFWQRKSRVKRVRSDDVYQMWKALEEQEKAYKKSYVVINKQQYIFEPDDDLAEIELLPGYVIQEEWRPLD